MNVVCFTVHFYQRSGEIISYGGEDSAKALDAACIECSAPPLRDEDQMNVKGKNDRTPATEITERLTDWHSLSMAEQCFVNKATDLDWRAQKTI